MSCAETPCSPVNRYRLLIHSLRRRIAPAGGRGGNSKARIVAQALLYYIHVLK